MVRKLKHHEHKLLRKTDFLTYKSDGHKSSSTASSHRAALVRRRYHLPSQQTYDSYNALVGRIRLLSHQLSQLPPQDPHRIQRESALLEKLFHTGILKRSREQGSSIAEIEKEVTVSAFCRRRLPVVMVRMGMVERVGVAVGLIEQGHVRVGTEVVSDQGYCVGRGQEDFVGWTEGSKVRRVVEGYRNQGGDDYDLL